MIDDDMHRLFHILFAITDVIPTNTARKGAKNWMGTRLSLYALDLTVLESRDVAAKCHGPIECAICFHWIFQTNNSKDCSY